MSGMWGVLSPLITAAAIAMLVGAQRCEAERMGAGKGGIRDSRVIDIKPRHAAHLLEIKPHINEYPALLPRFGAEGVDGAGAIDFVYTWEDEGDDEWKSQKQSVSQVMSGDPMLTGDALQARRTSDHEELKFSLRSLLQFMNPVDLGTVYIVTGGKAPKWLQSNDDRVRIVDYHDIIPDKFLPRGELTFNRFAVASWVHLIPGLSERFVVMDDDFFLGAPTSASDFFDGAGRPRVAFQLDWGVSAPPTADNDRAYDWAAYNADVLLDGIFQDHREKRPKLLYNAYPTTKRLFSQAHVLFRSNIESTTSHRLTMRTDVMPLFLAAWTGIYRGTAVRLVPSTFPSNTYVMLQDDQEANKKRLLELLAKSGDFKLICIRDFENAGSTYKTALALQEFFASYYSQQHAPWEVMS